MPEITSVVVAGPSVESPPSKTFEKDMLIAKQDSQTSLSKEQQDEPVQTKDTNVAKQKKSKIFGDSIGFKSLFFFGKKKLLFKKKTEPKPSHPNTKIQVENKSASSTDQTLMNTESRTSNRPSGGSPNQFKYRALVSILMGCSFNPESMKDVPVYENVATGDNETHETHSIALTDDIVAEELDQSKYTNPETSITSPLPTNDILSKSIAVPSPTTQDSATEADNAGAQTEIKPLLGPAHTEDQGKICLVLDLDETLVHSSFRMVDQPDFIVPVEIENQVHNVYVVKRPGVDEFLLSLGKHFEIVVFTASLAKYADPVLDLLDRHHVVKHRLFRESCYNHRGNYVKDLSHLGRDLSRTIIIDNSPASYAFHPLNAIPITSWFNDPHDTELLDLIPFLMDLIDVENVTLVLDSSSGS